MTATLKLGEILCESLVAKLKYGLRSRQDTINAEFDDDIVLNYVADESYFGGRVADRSTMPAIFVMEGPTRFSWEGAHGLFSETELLVYVFDADQTGPQLARRLQRQVRAVIECVWDDDPREQLNATPPFAGQLAAHLIRPLRTTPGAAFKPDALDEWRAFYTVVFSARQMENG